MGRWNIQRNRQTVDHHQSGIPFTALDTAYVCTVDPRSARQFFLGIPRPLTMPPHRLPKIQTIFLPRRHWKKI
jgi:hypothetical protein